MMRLVELLLCAGLACVFVAAGVLALTSANIALVSPLLAGIGITLVFLLDQLCSLNRAVGRQTDQRQVKPSLQPTTKPGNTPPIAVAREWNYKGRESFEGTYVSHIGNNKVIIERHDGKQVAGDIRQFSEADQRWLATWDRS